MAKNKTTVKLNTDNKDYLVVVVDGQEEVKVPLPNSLPLETMREVWEIQSDDPDGMKSLNWTINFFEKYLGDAINQMPFNEFMELSRAWQEAGNLGE